MTFAVDGRALNVVDFSESSEPVGAEWHAWENDRITLKQYIYGILKRWTLRCVEVNVPWNNSAAKYLQDKMKLGEKVTFSVSEGSMHQFEGAQCYIERVEVSYSRGSTQNKFRREFTVTLKSAYP